jgi:Carboxypeptidase regulatory-like domain
MKIGFGRTLVFGILFATSIVCGAGASRDPGFDVSGTILDQSGGVIPRASVRLFSLDELRQTKSDEQGKFAFTELPAGVYELQADYRGFQPTIETFKIVSQNIGPLSVTLAIAGTPPFDCGMRSPASYEIRGAKRIALAGAVIDSKDGPLAGAEVVLSGLDGKKVMATQRTDNKGRFKFYDLAPGKYTIDASVKDHYALPGEPFWITRGTLTKITLDTVPNGAGIVCE